MKWLEWVNQFVWGVPALLLILGVGGLLTWGAKLPQIRLFPGAVRQLFRPGRTQSGVTQFQALCTALGATVGTGNIAGVAGAIAIGGPGAIFWMWVSGLIGMGTKLAEATLAVRYRVTKKDGSCLGGPMYMISQGMGARWKMLASLYAFFGVVAAFGVGNGTQINAVISGVHDVQAYFGKAESVAGDILLGVGLAGVISLMLLGGAKGIGRGSQILVPVAAAGYVLLCAVAIVRNPGSVKDALGQIVTGAFSPAAVTGGALGSVLPVLRTGVARGVFTNEAGMGTASMAHAGAGVLHPVEQGLLGMVEVFVDTIVICTLTALVILTSGIPIAYGTDEGVRLTIRAFSAAFGAGISVPISLFLCCFALATVLGWGLYGGICTTFLFGQGAWKWFVLLQAVTVVLGTVMQTGTVWLLAELVNGLMAIPNLTVLLVLRGEFFRLVADYREKTGKGRGKP